MYITSVVRSRPYRIKQVFDQKAQQLVTKYSNRKPTQPEILAYAPFLDYEVNWVQPKIIITLGKTAAQDGYCWSKQKYQVFCTYHPAAVFYNRKLTQTIQQDWQVLKERLK